MFLTHHLNSLESSGLIRLAATQPELEYLFRHALIQDAAYRSLVKTDRRKLHLAVAEALEQMYPERLEELAGRLAHHFAAAGERKKAITYAQRAVHRAMSAFAYEEAVQSLRTALDLFEPGEQSETRLALLEQLGDVYRLLREGAHAISTTQQALDLWGQLPGADKMIAVRLHRKIIQTVADIKWAVDVEQHGEATRIGALSRASLEAGLNLLSAAPPHPEMVRLLKTLSNDAWRNRLPPDWDAAERYAQSALDVARQLNDPVEVSAALGALDYIYLARGRLREYLNVSLQRLAITGETRFNDIRERVDSLRAAGSALMYVGEYDQALGHLRAAESLAARIYAVEQQFNTLSLQIQCCFRLDRWDDALEIEAAWRDLERRYPRERVGVTWFALALSASIHALRGNFEQARFHRQASYDYMVANTGAVSQWQRNQHYWASLPLMAEGEFALVRQYMDQALQKFGWPTEWGSMGSELDLFVMRADLAAQVRDAATLPEAATRAEELAIRHGHRLYQAIGHRAWGVRHRLAGELDEAEARLNRALEIFKTLDTRWQIGRTLYELGELARARTDLEAARGYYSRALASFEEMRAVPDAARTRAVLNSLGRVAR